MATAPCISASLIVCDDIRHENNGKRQYIGIYTDGLIVSEVPFTLPQLWFIGTIQGPRTGGFPAHVQMRIELPGGAIHTSQPLKSPSNLPTFDNPETPMWKAVLVHRLAPFEISKPGRAKVWMVTEHEEFYAGSLKIGTQEGTEDSVDIVPILSTLAFIKQHKEAVEEDSSLQSELLTLMTNFIPNAALFKEATNELIVPNGPNNYLLISISPIKRMEDISVEFSEGATGEWKAKRIGPHIATLEISHLVPGATGANFTVRNIAGRQA